MLSDCLPWFPNVNRNFTLSFSGKACERTHPYSFCSNVTELDEFFVTHSKCLLNIISKKKKKFTDLFEIRCSKK